MTNTLNQNEMTKLKKLGKEIIIKVEGGCVVDVLNLPKHYKYIIDDADEREEDRDD